MSSFQQVCPSCKSILELPMEAVQKAAVCPACKTQFVADLDSPEAVSISPVRPVDNLTIATVAIESVLEDTRIVLGNRRRPLLLPFLIPSVLFLLTVLIPVIYLSDMATANRTRAFVWTAVVSPWFLLVTSYAIWFAFNLAVDVVDAGPQQSEDAPAPIRSWYFPNRLVFVTVLIHVLISSSVLALLLGAGIAISNSASSIQSLEIRMMISLVSFGGSLIGATIFAMRFWPAIPLAVDGSALSASLRQSLELTRANLMTSFLLAIAASFLIGVAFAFFGLGLPVAVPCVALMLVVGVRSMCGRKIPALESDEYWR